jgi:hypothetical protein
MSAMPEPGETGPTVQDVVNEIVQEVVHVPNKRRLIWVMVFVGVVAAVAAVGLSTLMQASEPPIETTTPQTVSSLV